jgi:hypothetical protein
MTRTNLLLLTAAAVAALPPALEAQSPVRVRTAGFYERYSFDPGLAFGSISEIAVPVAVDLTLGRFANLALSSGFVSIDLNDTTGGSQTLSGALDTELRLGMNVVPGRLIMLVSGSLPTGVRSVQQADIAILGALASDVIGFAVPSVGSGGSVGGGLVGAVPLGRFALGLGATYSYSLSYEPIAGDTREIRPGAEIRGRAGLEGPLGRTTYLRVTTVVARRGRDRFADSTQNGIGMRFIGYLELAQGFGNTQLTVYGYDVYRGSPAVEPTAVGKAILPKGNLIVAGLRFSLPVTPQLTIVPRTEFRYSSQAPGSFQDADNNPSTAPTFVQGAMTKAGTSLRFGLDARQRLAHAVTLVLNGGFLTGTFSSTGTDIGLSGFRFGLLLDITP